MELQQQTWLNPKLSSPHWSFVEFMCCYFDDTLCGNSYQNFIEFGYVSSQEYQIIERWHRAVDAYPPPNKNDYADEAILMDAEWLSIIKLGVEAKSTLLLLLSPVEAECLMKNINAFE